MATTEHSPSTHRGISSVRGYIAGTGASGSLLVAALVAFLAVSAFVAFDGLPFGDDGGGVEAVALDGGERSPGSAAATAAATAATAAPAAVAAAPAAGTPAAGGTLLADAGAGAPGPGPGDGAGPGDNPGPGTPPADPGTPPPNTPSVALCADGTAAPCNPVDEIVSGVDRALADATGLDPNLGGTTRPVTGAVDETVRGLTGNDVGGHLSELLDGRAQVGDLGVGAP
jgi:hypothetical protein